MVLMRSGVPMISQSGACASAIEAVTLAGLPSMWAPAAVAVIVYVPGVFVLYAKL